MTDRSSSPSGGLPPVRLILILNLVLILVPIAAPTLVGAADTPEQAQQYRYALGLIQRQLYEEAERVLNRVVTDPAPFSLRDGALFWLGECRYRLKDWTGAAAAYSQVLRTHPQSTFRDRAAYGLGWTHIKDDNPKSAVESFALVSKQDPKLWIDARLKMGFLMVRYGFDAAETQAVYEEILAQPGLTGPQQFEAHLQVGIGRFNASLFAEALTHFEKALPLAPADKKAVVQFYIGESLFRNRRFTEAEAALAKVAEASPTPDLADKALYSLAWCKIKGGKPAEAEPLFRRVADHPDSPVRTEATRNLVDLLMNLHRYRETADLIAKVVSRFPADEAGELSYLRALALSRLGEFTESLQAFRAFLKTFPKHVRAEDARYQVGLVQIALGKFREALADLEELVRRETTPAIREKALYRMGECHFNLGGLAKAREYFERVIREYPKGTGRVDALYQLGEIAYQSGDHQAALDAFGTIANSSSELAAQALFRSGEVLMKALRFVEAVPVFERYLATYPDGRLRDDALFKTGLCHLELKDTGKALAAFSQLRDSTGYFRQEARFQIGEIARQVGDLPLAIQQFKAIVTEDPKNPLASRARRAIGVSLFQMKDYEAAAATFREILKEYPATDVAIPECRLWLGRTLIAQGKKDDGILEVLKVPVLYPKSPLIAEAYAEAARAYGDLGRGQKALQMWREVVKFQSSGPLADEARSHLK